MNFRNLPSWEKSPVRSDPLPTIQYDRCRRKKAVMDVLDSGRELSGFIASDGERVLGW